MLAQSLGAGFLGGIVSGFLAGYLTKFLADKIRLPINLEGLKPVLILPFLSTISVGLLMIYVIAPPVQGLNNAMNAWLNGMQGANALLLGVILGGMMAFDMGGPINKAAYTFAVGLLASKIYGPMAAVMAGGMTPALGLGLAAFLFKSRFDLEEREAGGPALVLGVSFITEGAIPFAAKDPLRVIPALVLGSAIAGAISMVSGVQLLVPHGGIFAALIPGAVTNLLPYLAAIVTGTVVTTAALFILKKPCRQRPGRRHHSPHPPQTGSPHDPAHLPKHPAPRHARRQGRRHPPRRARARRRRQHRRRLRRKHARPRAAGEHLPRQRHRHPARHGQGPRTHPQDRRVAWCSSRTASNGTPARSCASSSASPRNRDEHLEILAALTDVLDDTATAEPPRATRNDPAEIIARPDAPCRTGCRRRTSAALAGAHHDRREAAAAAPVCTRGRRRSSSMSRTNFESEIRVQYGGKIANGKAMASLLKLGAEAARRCAFCASGPDADGGAARR